MADTPLSPLVVIEDSLLASLASNAEYLKEFPFLKGLGTPRRGCGKCGARNTDTAIAFNSAKQVIHGLSAERKGKLKAMLRARQLRVVYRAGQGKTLQVTF